MSPFDFFKERIKEASTIRALIVAFGLVGIRVSPELTEAIVQAVLSVIVAFEILRKERQPSA